MKPSGFLVLILLCVGCGPPPPINLGPAQGAGPVTCDSTCTVEWQRAQFWIAKHSSMKIQTATDVLVQTYNPTTNGFDALYGFTASREPIGAKKYRITLQPACVVNSFSACNPRLEDVTMAFYHYVATGMDVLDGKSFPSIQ